MGSILVDINLHKLAQNIGLSWPIKSEEETPAKYLEYSFDELIQAPGLAGQKARVQLLLDILKETAAFDDPFQDMMEAKPNPEKKTADSDQLLERFGVPPNFPLKLTGLSTDTKELCEAQDARTIGECVVLFQRMAQNVILDGEVRALLNSLAHGDESSLRTFLPLRAGSRGPHLAETLAFLIRSLPESQWNACREPSSQNVEAQARAQERINADMHALMEWFPQEGTALQQTVANGENVERHFHPLGDSALEQTAARLVTRYFAPEPIAPAEPQEEPSKGFLSRLVGFFRAS